ncbi:hypothetical protein A4X13_0g6548 [Tilletia indica]|uniref:Uncharacterized protein n=1 Tax=Tilletia indica TaxID=43049 RepID=A0A177TU50_9BASI|nr:hypothetical protein A4X13_0g6548 [Tilletia indica]
MRVCPACSSVAVEFIPEASGDVCTECGYTVDVVLLDGSKEIADGHGFSLWQDGMATVLKSIGRNSGGGWMAQSQDAENLKLVKEQNHLRDTRRFIQGTLTHLNRQRYADRAFGLFDVVRKGALARTQQIQEFWNKHEAQVAALNGDANEDADEISGAARTKRRAPKLFAWGAKGKALALACIFATIATSDRDTTVSLQEVIHSCGEESSTAKKSHLSFRNVAKRLRLVRDFGGPTYAHVSPDRPRFYLSGMVDFFEALQDLLASQNGSQSPPPLPQTRKGKERARDEEVEEESLISVPVSQEVQEFVSKVRLPRARTLSLQLAQTLEEAGNISDPKTSEGSVARDSARHMHFAAYAIVLWALEASCRAPGPQLELIALHDCALRGKTGVQLFLKRAAPNVSSIQDDQNLQQDSDISEDDEMEQNEGDDQRITDSRATIQRRYSEIRKLLNDGAKHIPWVLSASILASGRRRNQPATAPKGKGKKSKPVADVDTALDMARLDIIRWMPDILAFRVAAEKRKESHDARKNVQLLDGSGVQIQRGEESKQDTTVRLPEDNSHHAAESSKDEAVSSRSGPPPFTESEVVARYNRRLETYVLSGPNEHDAHDLDEVLFDEDEDPDELYLRSTPERVLLEQAMREDGRWDADVERELRREEKSKARAEKEERAKPKFSLEGLAAFENRKRTREGDDMQRRRKRPKAQAYGSVAVEIDAGEVSDGERPDVQARRTARMRPINSGVQEGASRTDSIHYDDWSDSSDDDDEDKDVEGDSDSDISLPGQL